MSLFCSGKLMELFGKTANSPCRAKAVASDTPDLYTALIMGDSGVNVIRAAEELPSHAICPENRYPRHSSCKELPPNKTKNSFETINEYQINNINKNKGDYRQFTDTQVFNAEGHFAGTFRIILTDSGAVIFS